MSIAFILHMTVFSIGFFGMLFLLGSLFFQKFRKLENLKEINGFKYFRCGGVFDWYNLTYPLVKLGIGKDSLYLKHSSFDCFIKYSEILRIDAHDGINSKGVKITHSHPDLTGEFIIWTPYSEQLIEFIEKKISNNK